MKKYFFIFINFFKKYFQIKENKLFQQIKIVILCSKLCATIIFVTKEIKVKKLSQLFQLKEIL